MYEDYARVYDRSGQYRFSLTMARYCRKLWALFGAHPKTLLDLACGTGTAAVAFHRQGLEVTGLDQSAGMLERARRKAPGIRWLEGDMRDFSLPERFDAVTCLYDSLNYLLTPGELSQTFERVAHHLTRDGLFVFDLATEHALAEEWGDSMEALASNKLFQVWHSRFDPETRLASMELTIFEPAGERYRMIEETHTHRVIERAEVQTALEKAGFRLEGIFQCFTLDPPSPETYRAAFVARRLSRERRA